MVCHRPTSIVSFTYGVTLHSRPAAQKSLFNIPSLTNSIHVHIWKTRLWSCTPRKKRLEVVFSVTANNLDPDLKAGASRAMAPRRPIV